MDHPLNNTTGYIIYWVKKLDTNLERFKFNFYHTSLGGCKYLLGICFNSICIFVNFLFEIGKFMQNAVRW
jgi:hypothetical protein